MENIVIIMAGGLGKRMKSELPKVLHKIQNKPMLVHVIERALELNPVKIYVIVGVYKNIISSTLEEYHLLKNIEFVNQDNPMGTGHAIQCCRKQLKDYQNHNVIILSGDVPLISKNTLDNMLDNLNSVKILTTERDNPTGYGRIILKENKFQRIIEEKDCNEEERKCKKTNSGIYAFKSNLLYKYLPYLNNNNSQNEYYLTDIIEIIKNHEYIDIDIYNLSREKQIELSGVNTKEQLEELEEFLKNN